MIYQEVVCFQKTYIVCYCFDFVIENRDCWEKWPIKQLFSRFGLIWPEIWGREVYRSKKMFCFSEGHSKKISLSKE
jgi:hypothetical protein